MIAVRILEVVLLPGLLYVVLRGTWDVLRGDEPLTQREIDRARRSTTRERY